ncbi:MAG TPA: hypothetical protein PK156_48975, partial [Polyangium sp.]|nr:hypothetical protein [Polyangium sp.]
MTNRIPTHFASRRILRGVLPSLLTLSGLLVPNVVQAQTCPPGKTCFYVPPILPQPIVAPQGYDGQILVSADANVSGTYSLNGNTPVPFTTTSNTPFTIPATSVLGRMSGWLVPENRGAFIVMDSPSVLIDQRAMAVSWQASATIKSATLSLGTRFRAGSYPLNVSVPQDDTGYDYLNFYAPTDTSITVTAPPGSTAPFWNDGIPGLSFTFNLSEGQTYGIRTVVGADIDGALITSTQPISVITGGRGWFSACGDEGREHLVPTNVLGKEFVVDDYPERLAQRIRVVTDTDNTEVRIN